MKFKVGDRVRVKKTVDENINGKTGKIIVVENDILLGVEFDEYIDGHTCDGHGKMNYCWYLYEHELEAEDESSDEYLLKQLKDTLNVSDLEQLSDIFKSISEASYILSEKLKELIK